ncbi:MAG: hypothetical protein R3C01_06510 [Planctomycetaceae bacterium]
MGFLKWLIGGGIAGLISAVIWAAIVYYTGYEIGWIAWFVGFAVGLGVRLAASDSEEGFGTGATAVVIAVLAIVLGKYLAVSFIVDRELGNLGANLTFDAQAVQVSMCDDIVEEWSDRKLKWPNGMTVEEATELEHYPAEVQKEVSERWSKLTSDQQAEMIETTQAQFDSGMSELKSAFVGETFKESFSGMDILFIVLAIASAYKLGSGDNNDD